VWQVKKKRRSESNKCCRRSGQGWKRKTSRFQSPCQKKGDEKSANPIVEGTTNTDRSSFWDSQWKPSLTVEKKRKGRGGTRFCKKKRENKIRRGGVKRASACRGSQLKKNKGKGEQTEDDKIGEVRCQTAWR